MTRSALFILFTALTLGAMAFGDKYKVDASHSELGFKVKHLGISTVAGKFKTYSGGFEFDPKTGALSNVKADIDAGSIDTNEPDRDKHLKSADFFETDKFPKVTFESTKVEASGGKPKKILGKLTIHGVTKEVALNVDWGGAAEDPWGNQRAAFSASGAIDRTDFGLKWNKGVKKAAGLLVANEVKIALEIEGLKE